VSTPTLSTPTSEAIVEIDRYISEPFMTENQIHLSGGIIEEISIQICLR